MIFSFFVLQIKKDKKKKNCVILNFSLFLPIACIGPLPLPLTTLNHQITIAFLGPLGTFYPRLSKQLLPDPSQWNQELGKTHIFAIHYVRGLGKYKKNQEDQHLMNHLMNEIGVCRASPGFVRSPRYVKVRIYKYQLDINLLHY